MKNIEKIANLVHKQRAEYKLLCFFIKKTAEAAELVCYLTSIIMLPNGFSPT